MGNFPIFSNNIPWKVYFNDFFSWITKKFTSQKINTSKFDIKFFKCKSWLERRNLFILIEAIIITKGRDKRCIWTFVNVDFIHITFYEFTEWYWIIVSNLLKLNFIETSTEQAEMVNIDVVVQGIMIEIRIVLFEFILIFQIFWDLLEMCFWPLTWKGVSR